METILKKEDGLRYGGGFFTRGKKGALVLTSDNISFVRKDTGEKTLSIPIKEILNTLAARLKNQDAFVLTYIEDGKEKKAEIWHRSEIGLQGIGGAFREPYFRPWETLVESMRLKKLGAVV